MNEDDISNLIDKVKSTIWSDNAPIIMGAAWMYAVEKKMHELKVHLLDVHNVCHESGLSDCATEHCSIHCKAITCVYCGEPQKKWQRCPDGVLCVFEKDV